MAGQRSAPRHERSARRRHRASIMWTYRQHVSARVSTLLNVNPLGGRYVFMLIAWNDYADPLRDELNRQASAFGLDLGPGGVLVEAYPQRMYEIGAEVRAKAWPDPIAERFDSDGDPIILIIDRDWASFDPREHPYAIVWVSELQPDAIKPLLQELARLSRRGDDVIVYLRDVAARQERDARVDDASRSLGLAARIASYVEIKPHIFGVAIDLKAILQDIAQRTRRHDT